MRRTTSPPPEGQHQRMCRPSSPDSIDFAIEALGGKTEALQLWKLPSKAVAASPQQRIAELEDEKICLRRDINAEGEKCKLLLELVPALRETVDQLQRKVEQYNVEVREACRSWEAGQSVGA
ncbi:hypothetical protein ARSEF4850_007380 [Beauveria asiatica]